MNHKNQPGSQHQCQQQGARHGSGRGQRQVPVATTRDPISWANLPSEISEAGLAVLREGGVKVSTHNPHFSQFFHTVFKPQTCLPFLKGEHGVEDARGSCLLLPGRSQGVEVVWS